MAERWPKPRVGARAWGWLTASRRKERNRRIDALVAHLEANMRLYGPDVHTNVHSGDSGGPGETVD